MSQEYEVILSPGSLTANNLDHRFARTSMGRIIAGGGSSPEVFEVRKEILEKSPIIKGWIEEPDSIPELLRKDGALHLSSCEPHVVLTLVRYLERDESSVSDHDFFNESTMRALQRQDPLIHFKIYKLAGSLA